jgi:hypothetical protein
MYGQATGPTAQRRVDEGGDKAYNYIGRLRGN